MCCGANCEFGRYRYDMSVEEAAELARRSIYHATFRDGASGGVASGTPSLSLCFCRYILFFFFFIIIILVKISLSCWTEWMEENVRGRRRRTTLHVLPSRTNSCGTGNDWSGNSLKNERMKSPYFPLVMQFYFFLFLKLLLDHFEYLSRSMLSLKIMTNMFGCFTLLLGWASLCFVQNLWMNEYVYHGYGLCMYIYIYIEGPSKMNHFRAPSFPQVRTLITNKRKTCQYQNKFRKRFITNKLIHPLSNIIFTCLNHEKWLFIIIKQLIIQLRRENLSWKFRRRDLSPFSLL